MQTSCFYDEDVVRWPPWRHHGVLVTIHFLINHENIRERSKRKIMRVFWLQVSSIFNIHLLDFKWHVCRISFWKLHTSIFMILIEGVPKIWGFPILLSRSIFFQLGKQNYRFHIPRHFVKRIYTLKGLLTKTNAQTIS